MPMSFMKKNLRFGESAFDAIGQHIFGNVDVPGGGLSRFGLIINEEPAGYLDGQQLFFFQLQLD